MIRNSTIKHKSGQCLDCTDQTPKVLVSNRCSLHYRIHRKKENQAKREQRLNSGNSTTPPKFIDGFSRNLKHPVHSTGSRGTTNVPRETFDKEMTQAAPKENPYFVYWMRYCGFRCEECGAAISPNDRLGLLSAQAHILPKSPNSGFPSVAQVLENHMTLGQRCGCHNRFDHSWHRAQQMKIWPVAIKRFKSFMHLIAPAEVRRLPDALRKIYDTENIG